MEKYFAIVSMGEIIIQEAEYIEHGFFIKIVGTTITLYEIPYGGGSEMKIGEFVTLIDAIEHSKTLT